MKENRKCFKIFLHNIHHVKYETIIYSKVAKRVIPQLETSKNVLKVHTNIPTNDILMIHLPKV